MIKEYDSDIITQLHDVIFKRKMWGPTRKIWKYNRDYLFYAFLSFLLAIMFFTFTLMFGKLGQDLFALISAFAFSFMYALPLLFIMYFILSSGFVRDTFYYRSKALEDIDKIKKKSCKPEDIKSFQENLNSFGNKMAKIFYDYFKTYNKSIRTYKIIRRDVFTNYDRLNNMISMYLLTNKKNTKILNDFKRYLLEIENKILIPTIDRQINIISIDEFFKKWDTYFKSLYKSQYEDFKKYHDRHIKDVREHYKDSSERWLKISLLIVEIVAATVGLLLLILGYVKV